MISLLNGLPRTDKRVQVAKARLRILELANEQGEITNKQAAKAARLPQIWFHLAVLEKRGLLRHADYNLWKPRRRWQRVEL
jgi:predicted ArsR family transcriptional regulator